MEFRLYFIVILIIGTISYALNWNSLSSIDPNCSKDILKISNRLLFTSSIVLITISFVSIFKQTNDIVFYPLIILISALFFIVLSIINLINSKQIKESPVTTPIQEKIIIEYTECVSNIVSIINLIIGIVLISYSVYYFKNEIINFNII